MGDTSPGEERAVEICQPQRDGERDEGPGNRERLSPTGAALGSPDREGGAGIPGA